jgi:hypothetical protein
MPLMIERYWLVRSAARRRFLLVLVASLMMVGEVAGLGPVAAASGAACVRVTGLQPPSPGAKFNTLAAVASFNGCDAWAVGGVDGVSFIEHWDGASWTQVSSPSPGSSSLLQAVTVVSASNAWAVGESLTSAGEQTLIEHWNGSAWSVVPSPSPGASMSSSLSGVAAASASSVWAVGDFFSTSTGTDQALLEHWNGSSWSVVSSPTSSVSVASLNGVAVTSASNAWAVGSISGSSGQQTLILHWDGTSWSVQSSPSPGSTANPLMSVTATSATDAWAVGYFTSSPGLSQPLLEHWDGTSWTVSVASAVPSGSAEMLLGVTANSPHNAFVVGVTVTSTSSSVAQRPVLLRWDGTSWAQVPVPSLDTESAVLSSVSASSQDVWMAGVFDNGASSTQALLLHCC